MIVLDDQLLGRGLERDIAQWYRGAIRFITDHRRNAMGKMVRGIYENGEIRLLEDPQVTGKQEVYIMFPDDEKPRVSGIPASAFQEIDGLVALGGNALEDSERLWEENLHAPNRH
jgi:hypothetical protein